MNIAYIPVRGGSRSIPKKNIKLMNGKPLVWYSVKAACECIYIDKVYVCTDDDEIAQTVSTFMFDKVEVVGRSMESASDSASIEYGMLEFAAIYDFKNIALLQATSPLITSKDLQNGFEILKNGTDSVLSVVPQKRFIWENDSNGIANPVNYDYYNRPRRQEFKGYFVENGAFYITSKVSLLKSGCRISGNIRTVEMQEESYYEIDEPSDWIIVENLMKSRGIFSKETSEIIENEY